MLDDLYLHKLHDLTGKLVAISYVKTVKSAPPQRSFDYNEKEALGIIINANVSQINISGSSPATLSMCKVLVFSDELGISLISCNTYVSEDISAFIEKITLGIRVYNNRQYFRLLE